FMSRRGRILLAAACACGALVLALLFARPYFARLVAEHARRETIARAAAALGAPVSIARSAAGFAPVVVVLEGLRLEGDGGFGLQAGSSIDSVEISGEPWSLLRWGSGPVVFHVERPRCVFALGSTASPAPPPASPAAKPAEVGVPEQGPPAFPPGSRVKVRRGTLSLLAPGGIQFTCDGFGLDCGPGSQP